MAKIITCPNCGYQQRKYSTLVEEALTTCVKCNFKWINIKSGEKKSPEVKIIMESENHYNYTLKNFSTGEKTFPVYVLNSNFVEPLNHSKRNSALEAKLPLPKRDLSSHILPQYNNISSDNSRSSSYQKNYDYYNSAKLYNSDQKNNYAQHTKSKAYLTPQQNKYSLSPQAQTLLQNNQLPPNKSSDDINRKEPNAASNPKPITYNSNSTYQGKADVSKYTTTPKHQQNYFHTPVANTQPANTTSVHTPTVDTTSVKAAASTNSNNQNKQEKLEKYTFPVDLTKKDINASTLASDTALNNSTPTVKPRERLTEFTYKNDRVVKLKQEVQEFTKNLEQRNSAEAFSQLALNTTKSKAYLQELDKIFHEPTTAVNSTNDIQETPPTPTKLDIKKPQKMEDSDIDIEKIDILNNRKARAKIQAATEFANYKKIQKELVQDYKKIQKEQLKKAASSLSELQHVLHNYANDDLNISFPKEKRPHKKKVKLLRDDVSYGELFSHLKNKYFDFSNYKNIIRVAIYILLIVVIIVGFNFNKFFNFSPTPPTLKIPNKAVSAIPVIDDGDITQAIRPLGAQGDIPTIFPDNKLSEQTKLKDMYISKEEDKNKEILSLNKDELLNKAQYGFEKEIKPQQSSSNSAEDSSSPFKDSLTKYTQPLSYSMKRLSFNILNDVNISATSIKWLESLGEKTLQTSVIITNKSRDKTYTIHSLELIFTDSNGKIINRKVITPNKTLSSLESIKLNIKSPDASIVTHNVYVFIKNYS